MVSPKTVAILTGSIGIVAKTLVILLEFVALILFGVFQKPIIASTFIQISVTIFFMILDLISGGVSFKFALDRAQFKPFVLNSAYIGHAVSLAFSTMIFGIGFIQACSIGDALYLGRADLTLFFVCGILMCLVGLVTCVFDIVNLRQLKNAQRFMNSAKTIENDSLIKN